MAIYYVRKDGNDTTGNGSTGTPWLTISKALLSAAIGGGDVINVGAGTYQESTSGLGYLYLARNFATPTIVQSESGVAADVVIQSALAGAYETRIDGGNNYTFRNVSFIARAAIITHVLRCEGAGNNLVFEGCVFEGTSTNISLVDFRTMTTAAAAFTFSNCVFRQGNTSAATAGFRFTGTSGQQQSLTVTGCSIDVRGPSFLCTNWDLLTVTNCTITSNGALQYTGVLAAGGNVQVAGGSITVSAGKGISISTVDVCTLAGVTVTNSSAGNAAIWIDKCPAFAVNECVGRSTAATAICLLIGADASTGNANAGSIRGGSYTAELSHGMLIGAASDGVTVADVTVWGGDQGVVLKGCSNVTVSRCRVTMPGAGRGLYFKGAISCVFEDCTVIVTGSGYALSVDASAPILTTNCTFRRNKVITSGASTVFLWVNAEEGGGNVCDYNTYKVRGTGGTYGWGVVKTVTVSSLAVLRAAWAGYGDGSNDSHSRMQGSAGWWFFGD